MSFRLSKIAGFVITLLFAMLSSVALACAGADNRGPGPVLDLPTQAEQCIRPTEFMRANHMYLLDHKRDQTVREGIRTSDASLQSCVECHAKNDEAGKAIPVNAPGQFCAACHEYTAVKMDCFTCHRTTPDIPDSAAEVPDIPAHVGLLAKFSAPVGMPADINFLRRYLDEVELQ